MMNMTFKRKLPLPQDIMNMSEFTYVSADINVPLKNMGFFD